MNKIGLIGGIGPESTILYYRQIVQGIKERLGENVLPNLTIETLSAFDVFSYCKERRYEELTSYVLNAINNLAAAGATCAALTGNTPNIVFNKLVERSPIPLISAIDATVETAKIRGVKRIGLLGTAFTMTHTFFKIPFEQAGIEVVVPTVDQIQYIQDRIETELEHGIITDETRAGIVEIISAMKLQSGIEQVILGCTELPLLLNDSNSPVQCLDTVAIHVTALVDKIAGK